MTVRASERTLPHNLEAEQSVLGAILIHNDAFNVAAELVDSGDFFRDGHRRVFNKMVDLNERGQVIDLVTLKDELARSGDLDDAGGAAYIAGLVDGVPRSTNVEHYARIVKEKSTLRSLISSADKILSMAYRAEEDADTLLDQAEQEIFSIAEDRIHTGFVALSDLVQGSFTVIEQLQEHKGLVTGCAIWVCRHRQSHVRISARRLGHHRRAAIDGKDELRVERGSACGDQDRPHRRLFQPGNVKGTAVDADAHRRG